jgi:LemA protein
MSTNSIALLVLLALLVFWGVGAYNRLVRQKNLIADAFVAIDLQFKDRHDQILRLVEVAGEYLQHDPQAMLPLMQARNAVSGANDALRSQPSSGRLVQLLMDAEQGLQDRIDHFWTDVSTLAMQADPKLRELAQQLSATQSRLAFACQSFNVAVAQFNAAQVQFPTLLLARLFGFAPAVSLQLGPSRA